MSTPNSIGGDACRAASGAFAGDASCWGGISWKDTHGGGGNRSDICIYRSDIVCGSIISLCPLMSVCWLLGWSACQNFLEKSFHAHIEALLRRWSLHFDWYQTIELTLFIRHRQCAKQSYLYTWISYLFIFLWLQYRIWPCLSLFMYICIICTSYLVARMPTFFHVWCTYII